MAEDTTSYIAWDGKRYSGAPPMGWFLGADNRWWPKKDLLESQRQAATSQATGSPEQAARTAATVASPQATQATRTTKATGTTQTPPPPTAQRSGLAPMPATRPTAPPGPTQRRRAVPQHRTRQKGLIIVGAVCGWIVLMLGVDLVDSFTRAGGPVITPGQVTTTEVPVDPLEEPTAPLTTAIAQTADPPPEDAAVEDIPIAAVFVDNGVELAVAACGPDVVTGLLSGGDPDVGTLRITIAVLPENDPTGEPVFISHDAATPAQRSTDPLTVALPPDIANARCQVTGMTVNQ